MAKTNDPEARRRSLKLRLEEVVANRRFELATAKCEWRRVRNERDSLERFISSRAAGWLPNGALQDSLARRDELVLDADTRERECRRRQESLDEAVTNLRNHFPPLWLEIWQWLTKSVTQ